MHNQKAFGEEDTLKDATGISIKIVSTYNITIPVFFLCNFIVKIKLTTVLKDTYLRKKVNAHFYFLS